MPATTCSLCETPAQAQCAHCGTGLCAEHAIAGQPFITARQLLTTIISAAVRAPGLLGDILFKELDKVEYCPDCREEIGARRQSEQLKFAGGMLLAILLAVGLPLFLVMS
jgi:hypothetical protein